MGWKIFMHSVRMVLDNLQAALRISLLLYLVQVALQVMIFSGSGGSVDPQEIAATPAAAGNLLIMLVFAVLASLWIAVGWHRYVLTGEMPAGWLPRWHGAELGSYLWRSIMIGLVIGLALVTIGAVLGMLVMGIPGLARLLIFGMAGLVSYVFFRIGLILPAAALGQSLQMRDAWEATKQDDKAILVLALISMAAQIVIGLPAMIDGDTSSLISLIYRVVVDWFVMMFGISLLTTLYGYFIERRRID
ncbi:hypothetical protein [Salipiger abyssi]|uniref:hypothetical protein n=1 Tax=Salipiger abyssi TaxID=1250539 RepID=UPI001A8CE866|nr:hypothetical protein [Salipiger abyssi]MBN9886070.1 hypothetical protein [Salipiger abyssi]